MNTLEVLGPALFLLTALGGAERAALAGARRRIPVRIHVNGTRGKSTTTRLIRAALAEGGLKAFGKTTGTAARFILPDGSEKKVRRLAAASIREQIAALRFAGRLGVDVIVLECMALKPELQWASENLILRSTISVITNARLDHVEEMGRTPEEIASVLGNTIPEGGILVTGDSLVAEITAERAAGLGAKVILARPLGEPWRGTGDPAWWAEDAGIALVVAGLCGIDADAAISGMRGAVPDPGAAREVEPWSGITALDASAANDPSSLLELIDEDGGKNRELLLVYNNRADRAPRLGTFLNADLPGDFVVTGYRPGTSFSARSWKASKAPHFVPRRKLETFIREMLTSAENGGNAAPRIVFCGNTKGWNLSAHMAAEKEGRP